MQMYEPKMISREDALKTIEKILKEQPGQWAPTNLVIDQEHFEIKRNRRVPISIYYSSVKEVLIYKKGREYRLRVIDKGNSHRLWIITTMEDQAYLFVDSIYELIKDRQ
jgi:hypothetical protein